LDKRLLYKSYITKHPIARRVPQAHACRRRRGKRDLKRPENEGLKINIIDDHGEILIHLLLA
jgi:hypothetical protein